MLGSITWRDFSKHMLRNRLSLVGIVLIFLLFLFAAVGPFLAPYSPYDTDPVNKLQGPSGSHWFGTDNLGRRSRTSRCWFNSGGGSDRGRP